MWLRAALREPGPISRTDLGCVSRLPRSISRHWFSSSPSTAAYSSFSQALTRTRLLEVAPQAAAIEVLLIAGPSVPPTVAGSLPGSRPAAPSPAFPTARPHANVPPPPLPAPSTAIDWDGEARAAAARKTDEDSAHRRPRHGSAAASPGIPVNGDKAHVPLRPRRYTPCRAAPGRWDTHQPQRQLRDRHFRHDARRGLQARPQPRPR